MVKLTILSDKMCRTLANIPKKKIAVNTKIELCGAFINEMNVTTVNYSMSSNKDKASGRFIFIFITLLQ